MNLILSIIILMLLFYLYFTKKEIKNIINQLNDYNILHTRKRIDIKLFDKDIEQLANSINNHIDIHVNSVVKQKIAEDELKMGIANISHDIRTPLTSILGYIQMSQKENLSKEKQMEYLNVAQTRSESLKNILENFFSLSIVQSPEHKLELNYINLNNLLYEVIAGLYENIEDKKMNLNIEIEEENLIILGDGIAVNRVIENLITNMIKYSRGNEFISLSKEKDMAVLTISNRVEDINKESIKLLFNRFYKQDLSRNSSDSSGLGLPITKSLMEKMEGNIKAELNDNIISFICRWKLNRFHEF